MRLVFKAFSPQKLHASARLRWLFAIAWLPALPAVADEAIYRETFDAYRDGMENASQVGSGLRLRFGGNLPGWRKTGQGGVHVVDKSGVGDYSAMIWEDNVLTLESGIAANERGRNYLVEYDLGPTV